MSVVFSGKMKVVSDDLKQVSSERGDSLFCGGDVCFKKQI